MKLVLALYGHPDAGGFWEQHCEKALRAVGFEQCPKWKCVFRHAKLNLMLVVYVDDFNFPVQSPIYLRAANCDSQQDSDGGCRSD